MASLCRRFNASCPSRIPVVWQPSSLVSLLLPVSACRPDHAPPRSHAPLQKLVRLLLLLLLASCALLAFLPCSFPRAPCATCSVVTTSSRRCRTSSPSCRCASFSSVSLDIEIAPSSPPTTLPLPLPRVLPPSAATALPVLPPSAAAALILLTCLLLGATLTLQLLPDIQLSGVRLRTRARFHFSTALRFSSANGTPSPPSARRLVPSRPSHVPPRARLIPRGRYLPCHIFHLGSFPLLVIVTVICPPTPRINSSISHHDFPSSSGPPNVVLRVPASSLLFLIWSPPATMRISIQYVWCLSKSSSRSNRFGCVGVCPDTNPRPKSVIIGCIPRPSAAPVTTA